MASLESVGGGCRALCRSPKVVPPEAARDVDSIDVKNLIFGLLPRVTKALASLCTAPTICLFRPSVDLSRDVPSLQPKTIELVVLLTRLGRVTSLLSLDSIAVVEIGRGIRGIRRSYKMAFYDFDVLIGASATSLYRSCLAVE